MSIALWNILFCHIPTSYFVKHFTNEKKLKHACEFQDKFLRVLHLLRNFIRLKRAFQVNGGSAKFKILHGDSMEFGRPWSYNPCK